MLQRYQAAVAQAATRGVDGVLQDFETRLAGSKAVICRSPSETLRLAESENKVYATYYQLADAEVQMPSGEKWDALRMVADAALFTNYAEHLRFAALTLTEEGLSNYGLCSWLLRTEMISHRASVMEENSTLFVDRHALKMSDADKVPKGYRATWAERAKLCVAKLAGRIDAAAKPEEYSTLLLRQGKTSAEDDFVEVQVYGPMTIRTIEQITLSARANKAERAMVRGLKEKLDKYGVKLKL